MIGVDSNSAHRVLVTGSSGFIGQNYVRQLKARWPNAFVVGLDVRETSLSGCDAFIRADIVNDDIISAVAPFGVTSITHLAALCKEPGFPWREYFAVNAEGTRRIVKLAEKLAVHNVVFTSTMMVFAPGRFRRSEADYCDPDTAYGTSKLLAEECLRSWRYGSPSRRLRIVRPGVVFGPGDYGNMVRLIKALRRRTFAYIGRSDTVKGCIYVTDLANLLTLLLDDAGAYDLYHAVYPAPTTVKQIVAAACAAWGIRRSPLTIPRWLAVLAAAPFAIVDPLGVRYGIHPRRIQKLYRDTDVSAERLGSLPWKASFELGAAFRDWRAQDSRFDELGRNTNMPPFQ